MAKSITKPCDPYSDGDLYALGLYVIRVVVLSGQAPFSIRAQVEYHGTIARSNDGIRTFTLDQLTPEQQDRIVAAAVDAEGLRRARFDAVPLKSYNRTGWLARYRQLAATAKGRAALQQAGVAPKRRTILGWLTGVTKANKANQSGIARAYEDVRMGPVRAAQAAAEDSVREVAETFDDVIAEAYGSNGVRFRNIQD